MFRGFEARKDADATQRYLIALAAAAIILLLLAGGAVALSDDEQAQDDEPEIIEVRFEELDQPEAPPPPPPPPAPPPPVDKPQPAARPAPRLDAPPPPPTKIERDPLPKGKADDFVPTADPGAAAGGDMTAMDLGGGGGGGFGGPAVTAPPPPPPPPKPKARPASPGGPIVLPEEAIPPKPLAGNTPPEFPPDARAAGIEGEVFLKIVVKEDGTVGDIEVKKGEEPFVSAAVAVVKDWKYSPALVDGKPTAVYRVIKVPFRLKS